MLCTHVGGLEVERGVVGPVLSWRAAAPVAVLQRSSSTQQESQELRTSSGKRSSDWRMACLQHVPNGRLLRPVRARPPVHQRVVRDEDCPRRALQQPAALPVRLDQVGGRHEMRAGQHLFSEAALRASLTLASAAQWRASDLCRPRGLGRGLRVVHYLQHLHLGPEMRRAFLPPSPS